MHPAKESASSRHATSVPSAAACTTEYLTIVIAGQTFGLPVLEVLDVIHSQSMTRVPSAPVAVAGLVNLRGRIISTINLGVCLGLIGIPENRRMSVVIERGDQAHALLVEEVGEVIELVDDEMEQPPSTISKRCRQHSLGIYRLEGKLLVVLSVERILTLCGVDITE